MNPTPDRPSSAQNVQASLVFDKTLTLIKELDIVRKTKHVFLVYAHERQNSTFRADAEVARQLIKWLDYLNISIVSDRTALGNQSSEDIGSSEDILQSQLCLLSEDSKIPHEKVDYVILCGSEQLKQYEQTDYYQKTYKSTLKKIYVNSIEPVSELSAYVNSQSKLPSFHHILTELAFLELRMLEENHGVISLLLNGTLETALPSWPKEGTNIRIEDPIWREVGNYQGDLIYQDQGLHLTFFKLLERIWKEKESAIRTIQQDMYEHFLKKLKNQTVTDTQIEIVMTQVSERLREEGTLKWQAMHYRWKAVTSI